MTDYQRKQRVERHLEDKHDKIDWHDLLNNPPMAPPADIFERLLTDYKLAIAEIELAHRLVRNETGHGRLSDYFTSTNNRLGFYYLMLKCAYVKQLYNITQIAEELEVSRQGASTLVQECLAEGWIEQSLTLKKHYQASKILIDADSHFALLRLERLKKIGYQKAAQPLQEYMKLCKAS